MSVVCTSFQVKCYYLVKPVYSTSALGQDLYKGEILLTNILQVVFLQSSLDHLRRLILTGQLHKRSLS